MEHLPFNEFDPIVKDLARISSKCVIISLPYSGYSVSSEFRIARRKERKVRFGVRIPHFWHKHKYDGVHYWEIGTRGYFLSRIKKMLLKYFKISEIKFVGPNKLDIIFILKKNDTD